MIEAYSHNYLKSLLKKHALIWPHNLTLSRLVARSLRRRDKSFIYVEVTNHDDYWPGILIPLCLNTLGTVLVVSRSQKMRLYQVEIPRLREEGLTLPVWEGPEPPVNGNLWLLDHTHWIKAYEKNYFNERQLIIPEAELFSRRLREAMTIKISSANWDQLRRAYPSLSSKLINLHKTLSQRLFSEAIRPDALLRMHSVDVIELKSVLKDLDYLPEPWLAFYRIDNEKWASWAELNHKLLDWTWYFQPLEPYQMLHKLFLDNPFVFLSGSPLNEFHHLETIFNVKVKLGGPIYKEPIKLFVPFRQPLPNAECFAEHLLDQSRRLILGRQGVTVVILDDDQLLRRLTSELAAEFGKRVIFQSTVLETNGILCCSSSWWLSFQEKCPLPEQLIVALLPFSSLELPLTAARVEAFKKQGLDWFRDLLLPELLSLLPKLVLPVRKNQGRIAILDGRLRSRSWGKKIFTVLEPWSPLDRLLPD